MTPEEIAAQVVQRHTVLTLYPIAEPAILARDIAAALCAYGDRRAAEERERCAEIAEGFTRAPMDYIDWSPGLAADDRARAIAAAIRANAEKG